MTRTHVVAGMVFVLGCGSEVTGAGDTDTDTDAESGEGSTEDAPDGTTASSSTSSSTSGSEPPSSSSEGGTSTSSSDDANSSESGALDECGDGRVSAEELCDDGNSVDADGCNGDCLPSGTSLWWSEYATGEPYVVDIEVDDLDRVLVAGQVVVDDRYLPFVERYADDGELDWAFAIDTGAEYRGTFLGVCSLAADRSYFVGSRSLADGTGPWERIAAALDDDAITWVVGGSPGWLHECVDTESGPLLAWAQTPADSPSSMRAMKLDTDGSEVWLGASYSSSGGIVPSGIALRASGELTLAGVEDSSSVLTRLTDEGDNVAAFIHEDILIGNIALGSDETIFVQAHDVETQSPVLAAFDSEDDLSWSVHAMAEPDGLASSVAVAPDGHVVIAGTVPQDDIDVGWWATYTPDGDALHHGVLDLEQPSDSFAGIVAVDFMSDGTMVVGAQYIDPSGAARIIVQAQTP